MAVVSIALASAVAGWIYLTLRWASLWDCGPEIPAYQVVNHDDDSLRVLMIGDSWAGMHDECGGDSLMKRRLEHISGRPTWFQSHGRGGAKSKDVYRFMSESSTTSEEKASGYCMQPFLQMGLDYCVVMVGINDAASCLGAEYYCENYRRIISLLLKMYIRPVVVEMPSVDIVGLYSEKPLRYRVSDWMKAMMTHCRMYDVVPYSESLIFHIAECGWQDSVVVVRKEQWNTLGVKDKRGLYLPDGIHMNRKGYALLDSCLAEAICEDFRNRRH